MSLGTTQSLKSAQQMRVRQDRANRLGSSRQDLGEGLMCPAGSGVISFDIYGRPANQNTLTLTDSACSNYTQFSSARRIEVENSERPYLNVCASGNRGGGDFLGVARDKFVQDLYGSGYGGNFVRHYDTPGNAPWDISPQSVPPAFYHRRIQPWTGSHDATDNSIYRG